MPRVGRFLFGEWLKTDLSYCRENSSEEANARASYTLPTGARHCRTITLKPHCLICEDVISGKFQIATLRWRLAPADWHVHGGVVESQLCSIVIEVDEVLKIPAISQTLESRYYQQQTEIHEISLTVNNPCKLVTRINF